MKNDIAENSQNVFLLKNMFLKTNFNFIGSRTIDLRKIDAPPPQP